MAFNLFPQTDFRQMDLNYVLEVSKQAAANLEEYAADKEQVVATQAAAEEALAAAQQDIQTATQAAASAGQDAQTATQAAGTATQAAADAEQDAQTASAAAATATAVQESIPADYTTLSNDVDNLKSDLNVANETIGIIGGFQGANASLSVNANKVTATKGNGGNWYALYAPITQMSFSINSIEYIPIAYSVSPEHPNYDFFLAFVNNSSANFGKGYVFAKDKNTGALGTDHALTTLQILGPSASYSVNAKIEIVVDGTNVTISYNGVENTLDISTVAVSNTGTGYFNTPIGGAICHLSTSGDSYTLTYETVLSDIEQELSDVESALSDIGGYRWTEKTWCAFGDSITAMGLYEPLVKNQLNIASFENMGIGGSTIAELYSGQTAAYCNRYDTIASGFDVITILGGTNDFGKNIPLGTKGNTDKTTFYGGVLALLKGIKSKFPTTPILFFTPLQRDYFGAAEEISGMVNNNGNTLKEYRDIIIELCIEEGIPCFDMYSNGGLYPENVHVWTTDGLHPNQIYWNTHYQLIGDFINKYIPT